MNINLVCSCAKAVLCQGHLDLFHSQLFAKEFACSGVIPSAKGGSACHMYVFQGAAAAGKAFGRLIMSAFVPSKFHSVAGVTAALRSSFTSIKQYVACALILMLTHCVSTEDSIIGGWSMGFNFAFQTASQLAESLACPRALFSMDPRSVFPIQRIPDRNTYIHHLNRENAAVVVNLAKVLAQSWESPKAMLGSRTIHFSNPVMLGEEKFGFQSDRAMEARISLLTVACEQNFFQNAQHMSLGLTHAWDIAWHIRTEVIDSQCLAHERL